MYGNPQRHLWSAAHQNKENALSYPHLIEVQPTGDPIQDSHRTFANKDTLVSRHSANGGLRSQKGKTINKLFSGNVLSQEGLFEEKLLPFRQASMGFHFQSNSHVCFLKPSGKVVTNEHISQHLAQLFPLALEPIRGRRGESIPGILAHTAAFLARLTGQTNSTFHISTEICFKM